jgi:hypothetical protein
MVGALLTPLSIMDAIRSSQTGCFDLSVYGHVRHRSHGCNALAEDISPSVRAPSNVYDHVLHFLKVTHGRKLCESWMAEIDISDVIH